MGKNNIKISDGVIYAIDATGVAIINKLDNSHFFISYPEAAVFLVLIENYDMKKSKQMLQAVLGMNKTDTSRYVSQCIKKWKDQKIFQQNG